MVIPSFISGPGRFCLLVFSFKSLQVYNFAKSAYVGIEQIDMLFIVSAYSLHTFIITFPSTYSYPVKLLQAKIKM